MSRITIVLSIVVVAAFVVVVAGYANSEGDSSRPTVRPVDVGEYHDHDAYSHRDHQGHEGHEQHTSTAELATFLESQAHATTGDQIAAHGQGVCPVTGQSLEAIRKAYMAKDKNRGVSPCCQGTGADPCTDGHGAGQRRNATDDDCGVHGNGH